MQLVRYNNVAVCFLILISSLLHSCGSGNTESKRNATIQGDSVARSLDADVPQPTNQLDEICIWSVAYGGKKKDYPIDILPTEDSGCIVLLRRTRNITKVDEVGEKIEKQVVRFDKNGDIIWDRTIPEDEIGDSPFSIAMYNGLLLIHSFTFTSDSSYLTTCNLQDGNILNKIKINLPKSSFLHVSKLNKIYVIGNAGIKPFISEITIDGDKINEIVFDKGYGSKIISVIDDNSGNLYFTGHGDISLSEGLWVGVIDSNCSQLWSRTNLLPKKFDVGNSIYLTSDNNLLVSGYFLDKSDNNLFVAKFDLTGSTKWTLITPGHNQNIQKDIIEHNNEYYILAYVKEREKNVKTNLHRINSTGQLQNSYSLNYIYNPLLCKNKSENSLFVFGHVYGFQVNGPGDVDAYLLSCDFSGNVSKYTHSYNIDISNDNNGVDLNNLTQVQNYIRLYRFDRYERGYSFNLMFNPEDENSGEILFSTHVIPKNGTPQFVSQNVYTYEVDSNSESGKLYFKTSLGKKSICLTSDGDIIMQDDERNQTYYFHHSER